MIYKLKDLNCKNINEVGGKAANLGELISFNINVPDGFVCTEIENKENVYKYYNELELNEVAVRSSAICEDGEKNSFAGQFETILNVKRDELLKNIIKCYESNKASNIQEYMEEKNILNENTKVAVIVQQMINGDFSGVMFTKNPITDKNEMILEYIKGTGEKLVQGEKNPTQIIINKNNLKIEKEMGIHRLNNITIMKIIKIGILIEKHYKKPQDIEWTIKNNIIYILQSRDITTIKRG